MYLVALAWMYVVSMMAVAEATSAQGSILGAIITFVMYGVLPLALVLYLLGTPARRWRRRAAEAAQAAASAPLDPDGGGHATGDAVAPEREKP